MYLKMLMVIQSYMDSRTQEIYDITSMFLVFHYVFQHNTTHRSVLQGNPVYEIVYLYSDIRTISPNDALN